MLMKDAKMVVTRAYQMRGYNIEDPGLEWKKRHMSEQKTSEDSGGERKGKKSFFRWLKRKKAQHADESRSSEDSKEEKCKKSFFGVVKNKISKKKKMNCSVSAKRSVDEGKKEIACKSSRGDMAVLEQKSEEFNFVEQKPTEPTDDMKLLMQMVVAVHAMLFPLQERILLSHLMMSYLKPRILCKIAEKAALEKTTFVPLERVVSVSFLDQLMTFSFKHQILC